MRAVARGAAVLPVVVAGFFGWVFHERYWRWRDCFNELGRCWDPMGEEVHVEGAGMIWGTFALVPLLVAVLLVFLARRRRA